jgi:hypothetical protein
VVHNVHVESDTINDTPDSKQNSTTPDSPIFSTKSGLDKQSLSPKSDLESNVKNVEKGDSDEVVYDAARFSLGKLVTPGDPTLIYTNIEKIAEGTSGDVYEGQSQNHKVFY